MARKPYLKLRRRIEDEGMNFDQLCECSGVPRGTFNTRVNRPDDKGTWSWKEIVAICETLRIPQEQIGEYFFPTVEKGESA